MTGRPYRYRYMVAGEAHRVGLGSALLSPLSADRHFAFFGQKLGPRLTMTMYSFDIILKT